MKRKDIEKNLSAAVSHLAPEDAFERISLNLTPAPKKERTSMMMTVNSKKNNVKKIASLAIAACLVVAVGVFGFTYYDTNLAVESVVDIDVNPSVELTTNKKDMVLEVKAINADGEKILDGMNLKNSELKVAVNAIIGSMLKGGYLNDDNGILVTVKNEDSEKAAQLRNLVVTDIDASLNEHNVSAPVINQTVSETSSVEAFAKANNISVGKATFVLNLAKKDPTLDAQDLAKLSLKDIAGIVNARKIDIKDIVDYDADDSIWENIADEVEDVNENVAANNGNANSSNSGNASVISSDKAKEIALKHAGVAAVDVSFIKVEYDYDDGIKKYDVEFSVKNFEYDYEINAESGKILKSEKDFEDGYRVTTTAQKSTNANNSNNTISASKAKEIALKHAGFSADKVSYIKAEYDYDDGVRKYEVEFKVDRVEYDYEINAVTGNVISCEKENDRYQYGQNNNTTTTKSASAELISAAKAKEIALKHAGIDASEASFVKAEYDYDDGVRKYEVEFCVGRVEYEYEINAVTGAVISHEADR